MKLGSFTRVAALLGGSLAAAAALAQAGSQPAEPATTGLDIPANARFLGAEGDPRVRKATAIVNGVVITRTDVDQRLALIQIANGGRIPTEELPRLRQQVLRNLVDEVLQIQAAEQQEIKLTTKDVDTYFERYAQQQFKMTPDQLSAYLRANGASAETIKRQIHGEMAWSRLQRSRIEPFVNVSE